MMVRGRVDDLEPLADQPGLDRTNAWCGGRELAAELLGAQVMAVGGVRWIRHGLGERLDGSIILPAEIDAESHILARVGGTHQVLRVGPRRLAARQCAVSLARLRSS